MAAIMTPNLSSVSDTGTTPRPDGRFLAPSSASAGLPQSTQNMRNGHLNLDTFSPVNQNGSFAFDRVLKSGEVNKRTRKTKQWKSFHLVLRPNLLSLYKDSSESRLLKQISLSDLTAVAYLKDPKGRRENVFGLYSPSRNFHLQAQSQKEVHAWVELIKREARIDDDDQDIVLQSPASKAPWAENRNALVDRLGSSSPEPTEPSAQQRHSTTRDGIRIPGRGDEIRRPSVPTIDYSGDELGPYTSDFSETATPPASYGISSSFGSFLPAKRRSAQQLSTSHNVPYSDTSHSLSQPRQISGAEPTVRNNSHASLPPVHSDPERVIHAGHLLALRTNRAGVRQWKRLWVVLRPKNIAFYKNQDEYAAILILPLGSCIDAVEIDPVSRSKRWCMQIITEEKGWRLSCESEAEMEGWLGALKMWLSWKK